MDGYEHIKLYIISLPGGINGQSFILESAEGSASLIPMSVPISFSVFIDAL